MPQAQPGAMRILVEVRLRSILTQFAEGQSLEPFEVALPRGATVGTLLETLGVPETLVGTIVVNHQRTGASHLLEHRDKILLFPPILAGG